VQANSGSAGKTPERGSGSGQ